MGERDSSINKRQRKTNVNGEKRITMACGCFIEKMRPADGKSRRLNRVRKCELACMRGEVGTVECKANVQITMMNFGKNLTEQQHHQHGIILS